MYCLRGAVLLMAACVWANPPTVSCIHPLAHHTHSCLARSSALIEFKQGFTDETVLNIDEAMSMAFLDNSRVLIGTLLWMPRTP